VYLDTRWTDEHQRERVRIFLKNEMSKAGAMAAGQLAAEQAWIDAQGERLIAQRLYPDAQGVALFACESLGLRETIPLRVPFENTFVVANTPHLRPLAAALEAAPPALVVFVDGRSARLIALSPDGAGEDVLLESDVPGHHRRGGWAMLLQSRYQRHLAEHRGRHFDAVADALGAMIESADGAAIVLAGDARSVAIFRTHLPRLVAERVVGVVEGARHEPSRAFVERAVELLRHTRASETSGSVDAVLVEAEGAGRAVSGIEATLGAVTRGGVDRLYILKRFHEPGRVCLECQALQPETGAACRWCGKSTREIELGEAMTRKVIAAGGAVHVLEGHHGLGAAGGVAGRLRHVP
jgi:peptide subunit release factor 1 (eRF1)